MAFVDVRIHQRGSTRSWSSVSLPLAACPVLGRPTDERRPQYWEIYKLRQVIGISLFFLSVDILGGVFSFLSLFFRSDLDIAAFVRLPPVQYLL